MKPAMLWAPWRINYLRVIGKQKKCIFCHKQDFTVFKTPYAICMLNIYPYNNGHLMVSPLRHVNNLAKLKKDELAGLIEAMIKAQGLLQAAMRPDGFNIGMNIGKSAGAGFDGHLHIHIVPRWTGDNNFMPALSGTKVISQSLKELLKLLKNAQSKSD